MASLISIQSLLNGSINDTNSDYAVPIGFETQQKRSRDGVMQRANAAATKANQTEDLSTLRQALEAALISLHAGNNPAWLDQSCCNYHAIFTPARLERNRLHLSMAKALNTLINDLEDFEIPNLQVLQKARQNFLRQHFEELVEEQRVANENTWRVAGKYGLEVAEQQNQCCEVVRDREVQIELEIHGVLDEFWEIMEDLY
ncbi:uncharacterized protein KY384_005191 [Bacidia gigantensis]|uniref:uncharacterized protein n=1 Tax=Bacidia gigantensis TaxID=2732470 RepID=UPI001D04D467|nr:uncharacterized protein KY384_005191 [Bacidia gigantensis]KAG8529710.1 hypothetical protein KY384_005191 [Bacidia gigantensis]